MKQRQITYYPDPTRTEPEPLYPESDGKPMAETDTHRDEMSDLIGTLARHFAESPDVYVSGNLLLYYEQGNRRASVAPDVFVVRGVAKHRRRIYKLWEEHLPPTVVIELTSRSTRREDQRDKYELYTRLGVAEYFLYDPLGEYLKPPFQGYRLQGNDEGQRQFVPIPVEPDGARFSQELGLWLKPVAGQLRLRDPATGHLLPTPQEESDQRRHAEQQAQYEAEARRIAEQRAQFAQEQLAAAQDELQRLRDELARLRGGAG